MAILHDLGSNVSLPLAARVVVGRATTAALRVQDKRVSGEHATLRWTGSNWEVRDLGSRNGTFVDGSRIGPGESASLAEGSKLSFGDPAAQFVLSDAGAPGAVARDVRTGVLLGAVDGLLGLPSADQPEMVVYCDLAGVWLAEAGDERREVTDGDLVEVGGHAFSLSVPELGPDSTATVESGTTLDAVTLRFGVSLDEEHVQLTVIHRGKRDALEPREHGYVLLTLARKRLEDRALPQAEQGWIDRDRLLRMLQLDANGLNVAIYRARGQLASSGIENAVGIVEVRRGQRRIGIDPDRLEVGPLD